MRFKGWAFLVVVGTALAVGLGWHWLSDPGPALGGLSECQASVSGEPLRAADFQWSFRTLSGRQVSLSQFRGRPLVLVFWATWCSGCVQELPSLERFREALGNTEAAFVAVALDDERSVRDFAAKSGLRLPVYVATEDPPWSLRPRAIPTVLVIDREGRVVLKRLGATRWESEKCLDLVRGL